MTDNYDEADEVFFDEEMEDDFEEDFDEEKENHSFLERKKEMREARNEEMEENEEFSVSEDDFEEEYDEEGLDDEEGPDDEEPEAEEDLDDEEETSKDETSDEDEYESVCFVCRRPESKTGKQFKLPNNICVCNDCMHKTMDAVSQFDYQGMLSPDMMDPSMFGMMGMPNMGMTDDKEKHFDMEKLKKQFPNISFVNISDLQGDGGIPNKQKLKKKKKATNQFWTSRI